MAGLIPTGWYMGTVLDHGFGPQDGKEGTPYLAVKFELTPMEGPDNTVVGSITAYLYLSDAAIEHTTKRIRDIGYEGEDEEALANGTAMKGMRAQVQVIHEIYQGKERMKVGFINPEFYRPGVQHGSLAKDRVRRLTTLLKATPASKDALPL